MGYTHYWRISPTANEAAYQKALSEIEQVVRLSPVRLFDGNGEAEPELIGGISFNGDASKGEEHESFDLPARACEMQSFEFCKTAEKPYDIAVCAALTILKDHLGTSIKVSSDGNADEWTAGVRLASKAVGRILRNPIADTD